MFENPRRGRQARNFTTNVPKILDLKSSSEQIFFRKLSLGAPDTCISPHEIFSCLASGFSEWTSWSACSRTCRYLGVDGTRKRTRFCRIPELGCVGREIETKECNIRQCEGKFHNIVICQLSHWVPFGVFLRSTKYALCC